MPSRSWRPRVSGNRQLSSTNPLLSYVASDDQQASASRLTKAAEGGGVGVLIDALVGFPDRF